MPAADVAVAANVTVNCDEEGVHAPRSEPVLFGRRRPRWVEVVAAAVAAAAGGATRRGRAVPGIAAGGAGSAGSGPERASASKVVS
jgi:hypothetical protein